jgi:hypothetical protein
MFYSLPAPPAFVIQLRELVASEGFHVVIAPDISVNRVLRQKEGNIGKITGKGNVTGER